MPTARQPIEMTGVNLRCTIYDLRANRSAGRVGGLIIKIFWRYLPLLSVLLCSFQGFKQAKMRQKGTDGHPPLRTLYFVLYNSRRVVRCSRLPVYRSHAGEHNTVVGKVFVCDIQNVKIFADFCKSLTNGRSWGWKTCNLKTRANRHQRGGALRQAANKEDGRWKTRRCLRRASPSGLFRESSTLQNFQTGS